MEETKVIFEVKWKHTSDISFSSYPCHSQNCTFSHLYLHGNCDYLLCADQRGILYCDVCRWAPGLPSRRCGKQHLWIKVIIMFLHLYNQSIYLFFCGFGDRQVLLESHLAHLYETMDVRPRVSGVIHVYTSCEQCGFSLTWVKDIWQFSFPAAVIVIVSAQAITVMIITSPTPSATPSNNLNHCVCLMLSHMYSPQVLWSFLMQLVLLPVYDEGLKCLKKGVKSIYLFLEGCGLKWITLCFLSCRQLVKVYTPNFI